VVPSIPLARPDIGEAEIRAATAVLESGMLVSGAVVERFERGLAERCGRRHAIAVANGTAALELALRALGVDGGEVLVPALTWPSPAHAAAWVGATPRLIDIDPDDWNAPASAFAAARSGATRCAIAIDQFGVPARHEEIAAALDGVPIVEDAACAIGSALAGRPCGSFGDIACLSFHPRKVLTTGEGGACLTDDDDLADTIRVLRNHGQQTVGDFVRPGPNLRLTEFQAAIGLSQLERLDATLERRRALADRYRAALPALGLEPQAHPAGAAVNEQTFGVLVPEALGAAGRDRLIAGLGERGIGAGILSYALTRIGSLDAGDPAPVAEDVVDRGLALPLYATLTDGEADRVIAELEALSG
jgi:perosamine synthetase